MKIMKAALAMEANEEINSEAAIELNQAIDNDLLHIQEQSHQYAELDDQINEAVAVMDTLASIGEHIGSGDVINEHEADAINIAVEHFCKRLGHKKAPTISLEGYSSPKKAIKVAMEGLGNFINSIWEAIKAAFTRLFDWLKGIWNSVFGKKEKIEKKTAATVKRLDEITLPTLDTKKMIENLNITIVPKLQAAKDNVGKLDQNKINELAAFFRKNGELIASDILDKHIAESEDILSKSADEIIKTVQRFCQDKKLAEYFRNVNGDDVFSPEEINKKFSELLRRYRTGEDCYGIGRYINNFINDIDDRIILLSKADSGKIEVDQLLAKIEQLDKGSGNTTIKGLVESLGTVDHDFDRTKSKFSIQFPFDRCVGIVFPDRKAYGEDQGTVSIEIAKFKELSNDNAKLQLIDLNVAKQASKINTGFIKDIGKDLTALKKHEERLNDSLKKYRDIIGRLVVKYGDQLKTLNENDASKTEIINKVIKGLKRDSIVTCRDSLMFIKIAFELATYAEEAIFKLDQYINYTAEVFEKVES